MLRKPVEKVCIVGGGVGGLTLANVLAANMGGSNVTVVDDNMGSIGSRKKRGLGLWPQSQTVLKNVAVWEKLNKHEIPPAAYRDVRGNWLSSCSAQNQTRVVSVLEDELINSLLAQAQSSMVNLVRGRAEDVGVNSDGNFSVETTRGIISDCDILVGADGPKSVVRSHLFPTLPPTISRSTSISILFDGHSQSIPSLQVEHRPFETLGRSKEGEPLRFAVVPFHNGHFCFGSFCSSLLPHSLSTCSDDQIYAYMKMLYAGFHSPIPELIEYGRQHKLELLIEQSTEYTSFDPSILEQEGGGPEHVYLIGDAWNLLPPNLAQGASVSIEDAWELGLAIARMQPGMTSHQSKEFITRRRQRHRKYRQFTGFTHFISNLNPTLRDKTMKMVPSWANSYIFDRSLMESLGGQDFQITPEEKNEQQTNGRNQ